MKRHSGSFFVSILVHLLLLVAIFYSYKYISSKLNEQKKEKIICIKLNCLVQTKEIVVTPKKVIIPKKLTKKKKPTPKKIIPKVVKKVILLPDMPKPVEEDKPTPQVEEKLNKIEKKEVLEVKEPSKTPEQVYIDKNIEKIVQLLQENLYYPRRARKRGIQGEVIVKFILSKNAEVTSCEIVASKKEILSRAAIETIKSLSGKFPKPKEELTLSVPISYSLK